MAQFDRRAAYRLRHRQPGRAGIGVDQNFHPAPLMRIERRAREGIIFVAVGCALAVGVEAVAIIPGPAQRHLELDAFQHVGGVAVEFRHQPEEQHAGLVIGVAGDVPHGEGQSEPRVVPLRIDDTAAGAELLPTSCGACSVAGCPTKISPLLKRSTTTPHIRKKPRSALRSTRTI